MPTKTAQTENKSLPASARPSAGNLAGEPKLRFPGFSGGWEEKKLGEVGNIVTGTTPPTASKEYYGGNFPWITPTDIDNQKNIYTSAKFLTQKGIEKGRFISKNSLLVTCIASIGKNAILKVDGSCNQQINTITPNDKYNVDFLYYLIEKNKNTLVKFAGAGGMQMLNKKDFSNIKFKIATLSEQRKIASFLGAVDEWIENLRAQKELSESYKKGMMQKIFSQEIRFKDDSGKNFPKWEEKKLGEVFVITAGKTKSQYITATGENIIVDMGGISSDGRLIANKYTNYSKDFLTTNDLVMPKDDIGGGFIIGRVAKIPENNKYICGDHIFKLTKLEGVIGYLFYAINSFEVSRSLRKKANGTAQFGLGKGGVEDQAILFPPVPEQQKIADFLTSIDKVIQSKQQQIAQAEQWKKGLMQGLFV